MKPILLAVLALSVAAPALAQPFIIELNKDKEAHPPAAAPAPVAPPQSKPSEQQSQQTNSPETRPQSEDGKSEMKGGGD